MLQVLNESNKCNRFDSYSVGKSVLIILHDYYLSGVPYTFFPTIFLQAAMCYEEFIIRSVRQFDKSINHTFSLQSINKSIRHRVEHYLEHAPIIVIFEFFFVFFLFFVLFCFLFFVLFCVLFFFLFLLYSFWLVGLFRFLLFCFVFLFVCFIYLVNLLQRYLFFFFFLCVVLPSNPRNITVPFVNQSSAVIRWLPPVITGGQIFYEVECKRTCEINGKDCVEETCDDTAGFVFKDKIYSTKVMIPEWTRALSAYVNYTCRIIARNRVSQMAKRKHKIEASSATISFRTRGTGKS